MKLHILNDLHVEFGPFDPPDTDADVVVLAGDIDVGIRGLQWAASRFVHEQVIYVPGNHEFYGHDIALLDELRSNAPPNTYVLDDNQVELAGVRFLGCVLWTDFALFGEAERFSSMEYARLGMNDFQLIKVGERPFQPHDAVEWHQRNRNWLAKRLAEPFPGKTVVVTHHGPSPRSIASRFSTDHLSAAFASNLEGLMGADRVALWIHGHTHDSFDYEVNGTRVVCNPRGYVPHESNSKFTPDLVVEI